MTLSGRSVAAARSTTGSDEVVVAMMASGLVAASSCSKTAHLVA